MSHIRPIILKNEINPDEVAHIHQRLTSRSMFPYHIMDKGYHLPTAAIRWFKDSHSDPSATEIRAALAKALGAELAELVRRQFTPDAACAALSSWETSPVNNSAAALLAQDIAKRFCIPVISPFKRTSPREPMRMLERLSGSQALLSRIKYCTQDLVFTGQYPGFRIILIDDIRCLGATESVLAWSLERFGEAAEVFSVNISQISELGSHDLIWEADIERIRAKAQQISDNRFFQAAYFHPEDNTLHLSQECSLLNRQGMIRWWAGLNGGFLQCASCRKSSWLQVLFRKG